MTPTEFCYWLQGHFELNGTKGLTLDAEQVVLVKKHLDLVFAHSIDPAAGDAAHQQKLNDIHNKPGKSTPRC